MPRKRKSNPGDQWEEIEAIKKRIRNATAKGDFKELANFHNQLGNAYRLVGEFEESLDQHKKEIEMCKAHNPDERIGIGIGYRNIGEVYLDMKQERKAIPYIQKYLDVAKKLKDSVEEQRAHITLGRGYLAMVDSLEDSNEAEKENYLKEAEAEFLKGFNMLSEQRLKIKLSEKELLEMTAGACLNLGIVYDLKDQSNESNVSIKKAIDIATQGQFYECLLRSHVIHYGVLVKLEKLKEARNAALVAFKVAKILGLKSDQIEAKFMEAKVLLLLDEIEMALKILKKIRKEVKLDETSEMLTIIDPIILSVLKIIKCQDKLFGVNEFDDLSLKTLNENLADQYANIDCFTIAINFYLKSLKHAKALHLSPKEISRLYFSIGITYKDKSDYDNAILYFYKEIEIHQDNPTDAFKTQTNITSCLEKGKKSQEEIVAAHEAAIKLSKRCNNPKRVALAYTNAAQCIKKWNLEESKILMNKAEQIKQEHNITDLDEEEEDSQDLLKDGESDDFNLDNLTTDESEEEEESELDGKNDVGRKKIKWKPNEKGESPLHIACKKGDLKGVRRLLAKGHPLNLRDSAGWTSLHEACNYGHLQIVHELIEKKVNVNDPGGEHCQGITPLHDSANNGHFGVMTALLNAGANVLTKDDSNNMPIDCLIQWKNRTREEGIFTPQLETDFKEMKILLKSLMKNAGREYTKRDEEKANRANLNASPQPKFSFIKKGRGSDPIPSTVTVDDFDPDNVEKAVDLYSDTMTKLRRRNVKKNSRNAIDPGEATLLDSTNRDALLPESQNVDEDWLDDDMNHTTIHKRKRDPMDDIRLIDRNTRRKRNEKRNDVARLDLISGNVCQEEFDLLNQRNRLDPESSDEENENEFPPSPNLIPESPNLSEEELMQIESFTPISNNSNFASSSAMKKKPLQQKLPFGRKVSRRRLSSDSDSSSHQSAGPSGNCHKLEIHRLKVTILDKTILVPISGIQLEKNIDWLCEECSERYFKVCGIRPKLRLQTEDGADLSGSDSIRLVLAGTETKLIATVFSYDLKPLPERYKNATKDLAIEYDEDIFNALNLCESSNVLNLNDILCVEKKGKSIFSTLQCQYSLREIYLSGCSLYDEGIKNFVPVLSTLNALMVLDLSCNGITSIGFSSFVQAFEDKVDNSMSNQPLGLSTLILNDNPLGDSIIEGLTFLIAKLTHLQTLSIEDCNLTYKLFSHFKSEFSSVLSKSKLEELKIGYNSFGEIGLEMIFMCLNPGRIKFLDLTSTGITNSMHFGKILRNFFSQNEDCSRLKELVLSDCHLEDEGLLSITENFQRLVSLECLILNNNEDLTLSSLETLLSNSNRSLKKLDFGGCTSFWSNYSFNFDQVLASLEKKFSSEEKLEFLRIPSDSDSTQGNYDNYDNDEPLSLKGNENRIAQLISEYSGYSHFKSYRENNSVIYTLERL